MEKETKYLEIEYERDDNLGISALRKAQKISEEKGNSTITLAEINEEIEKSRK